MQCSMSEYGPPPPPLASLSSSSSKQPDAAFRTRSEPGGGGGGAPQRASRESGKRGGAGKRSTGSASVVFDSGVSMVGDDAMAPVPNLDIPANERVFNWMIESDKYGVAAGVLGDTESLEPPLPTRDAAVKLKRSHMKPSTTPASPSPHRTMTRGLTMGPWLKTEGVPQPMHPVPLESPGIAGAPLSADGTVEEAKKRLEDETKAKIKSSKKKKTAAAGGSTSSSTSSQSAGDFTVIGYYFCGDPVPYRTKLAGKRVTLKQFKGLITKKGTYKYFFKKASDEFGTGVVNEEITDDNDILPLWEGKIFAKVESIE
ncbi:PREDICTED: axin-1-like [Priapulus caudatus]|uniref:Axin-1-like n=1 Tax=Priapulus caudatus TaxID=37621 RepID=A0ABM1E8W9_PRICU|nr:PREDICTED: axin-1-like [Priapulus caudatus]